MQCRLTNITVPETIHQRLAACRPGTKSFFVRTALVAFESAPQCGPGYLISMPDLGKCYGDRGKFTIPIKFSRAELAMHRRIAKRVANGSVSALATMAIHWAGSLTTSSPSSVAQA